MSSANSSSSSNAHLENQIISTTNPISTNPISATIPAPTTTPPSKECHICFETYNRSTRTPIKCPSCGYQACRQCHTTFILDASNPLPNCMQCHKEFQREFLVENFTLKFVSKDLKESGKLRKSGRGMLDNK